VTVLPSVVDTALPAARFRMPLPAFLRRHNLQLWIGIAIVAVIFAIVFLGPLVLNVSPVTQDLTNVFAAPGGAHLLGTDQLGRDLLARLLHGGRTDLAIAIVAVVVPLVAGSLLGAVSGYFGGWVDTVIMRIADLVSAFPFYVLVIALVFVLGNGATSIFVAISIVSWVAYARIVRGETMVLREREFIAACRASGLPDSLILVRHVLPNTVTQAVIFAMSDIVLNIGVIVTLSYFGLGIIPPTPDWGQMMNDGQQYLAAGRLSLTLLPGFSVVAVSFGLALIGDGLATALRVRR
jgi:peptide/nickel transport system permease protein